MSKTIRYDRNDRDQIKRRLHNVKRLTVPAKIERQAVERELAQYVGFRRLEERS